MYFGTKNTLKNYRNRTPKQALHTVLGMSRNKKPKLGKISFKTHILFSWISVATSASLQQYATTAANRPDYALFTD